MSNPKEKCILCEKTFGKSASCNFEYIISTEEKTIKRMLATKDCKVCGVREYKIHHLICSEELCPICKNPLNTKKCKHEWYDFARVTKIKPAQRKKSYFVTTGNFMILTLLTIGLYPLYWMFRTWKFLLTFEKSNLNPLVLTIFWPIYIWSFSKRIKKITRSYYYFHTSVYVIPTMIFSMYFAFLIDKTLLGLLPFVFIPFLNLQKSINHVYVRMFPENHIL